VTAAPTPTAPEVAAPLRALLAGLIDYAGLFPPAALSMTDAVAEYARQRRSADAWVLGRFVVPAARLEELAAARRSGVADLPWPVSALVGPGWREDSGRIAKWSGGAELVVDALEFRATHPGEVDTALAALGRSRVSYVEVPVADDPGVLLGHVARLGLRAKIRTGGVTGEQFPSAANVVRFMERCRELALPFKATAGLHHPLTGEYRLTYEPDSAKAPMFGFLTLLAAAAAVALGWRSDEAVRLLEEQSGDAFRFDTAGLHWRGRTIPEASLLELREAGAIAFGSCSFSEPLTDLRALGYLPA